MKPFVFFSRAGCLLPLLIVFNFFFGWIFLKPLYWLLLEAILILLFSVTGFVAARTILRPAGLKRRNVIDVKGEIIEEHPELK